MIRNWAAFKMLLTIFMFGCGWPMQKKKIAERKITVISMKVNAWLVVVYKLQYQSAIFSWCSLILSTDEWNLIKMLWVMHKITVVNSSLKSCSQSHYWILVMSRTVLGSGRQGFTKLQRTQIPLKSIRAKSVKFKMHILWFNSQEDVNK